MMHNRRLPLSVRCWLAEERTRRERLAKILADAGPKAAKIVAERTADKPKEKNDVR